MMNQNGRCDHCLKRYEWGTDGEGHHIGWHPIGECRPPRQGYTVTYAKCRRCPNLFPLKADQSGRRTVFCSVKCRTDHFVEFTRNRRAKEREKRLTASVLTHSLAQSA